MGWLWVFGLVVVFWVGCGFFGWVGVWFCPLSLKIMESISWLTDGNFPEQAEKLTPSQMSFSNCLHIAKEPFLVFALWAPAEFITAVSLARLQAEAAKELTSCIFFSCKSP